MMGLGVRLWIAVLVCAACSNAKSEVQTASEPGLEEQDPGLEHDASTSPAEAPIGDLQCWPISDGERLEAIRGLGDDGSVYTLYGSWFDTELGIACGLRTASDGVVRCLPRAYARGVSSLLAYADTECTEPVTYASAPCSESEVEYAVVTEMNTDHCATGPARVYETGSLIGATETVHLLLQDGNCLPQTVNAAALYEIGREVPPETFVALDRLELTGERMQGVRRTLSDGASEFTQGSYDAERHTPCSAVLDDDGAAICMPPISQSIAGYADAECSEPLVLGKSESCPRAEQELLGAISSYAVEVIRSGVCERIEYRVYEPLAPGAAPVSDVFAEDLSVCAPAMPAPSDGSQLLRTRELSLAALPHGVIEPVACEGVFSAGTRLQTLAEHWADGSANMTGFFDTERGTRCRIKQATDGALRCLPETRALASGGYLFVDDACTRTAAHYDCARDALDDYDSREYAMLEVTPETPDAPETPAECNLASAKIYTLIGPELSTGYQLDAAGACVVVKSDVPWLYRELGREVPAASFVAFEFNH